MKNDFPSWLENGWPDVKRWASYYGHSNTIALWPTTRRTITCARNCIMSVRPRSVWHTLLQGWSIYAVPSLTTKRAGLSGWAWVLSTRFWLNRNFTAYLQWGTITCSFIGKEWVVILWIFFEINKKYLGKVWENSRAGENPGLCLGFLLICSRIFPNVHLGFHQVMKARKTYFIS